MTSTVLAKKGDIAYTHYEQNSGEARHHAHQERPAGRRPPAAPGTNGSSLEVGAWASRLGYTPEEVTRLLTHAGAAWDWLGARDKAIVTLLVGTGIRAEGLLGMTVDSILWAHGNRQIVVREKGSKERRVTLGEKAARAVKDYLRVRPQVESNALWLTFRRSPMTYGTLNAMLKHLGEYAGVDGVIPHRFRHTFAYQHYQRHKDIKAIQNALGHERVETTDKYLRSLGINYGSELETPDAWLA